MGGMRTRTGTLVAVLALTSVLAFGGAARGHAASSTNSVLALTYAAGSGWSRLGPVDPFTLRPAGETVNLRGGVDSWSFSPDRQELALAGRSLLLSVVDAHSLQLRTELQLAERGDRVQAISWLQPSRLLALVAVANGVLVVAVDPHAGRIVRRTLVGRLYGYGFGRLSDRLAFLLESGGRIGPPRVAFADADGRVRVATVSRMLTGSSVSRRNRQPRVRQRTAGFAVDPAGGRAYVVDRDFSVAEIDPLTLAIRYHAPTGRTVATTRRREKLIEGSARSAAWLGGGQLVAGGVDWKLAGQRSVPSPLPIRLIDVRTWSFRALEARGTSFQIGSGLVLVRDGNSVRGFAADGSERYRTALPAYTWLTSGDGLLYACRNLLLTTVLDAETGSVVRAPAELKGSPCAQVLVAAASPS